MSTTAWILLGIAVWVVLAIVVALIVGRVVRLRDGQIPDLDADVVVPGPRDGHGRPAPTFDDRAARRRGGAPPA